MSQLHDIEGDQLCQ